MARPLKEGLDYFPLVTHFEDKVILLISEFGASGVGILVSLYQKIYCNGYYIDWSNDSLMLFSRYINEEITRVNTVINRCLDRNIFCKSLYEKYGILTSHGIQKQYLKICKESRKKNIRFIKDFCLVKDKGLLDVITELTGVITELTPVNECINTQSKVKESKVKDPPYSYSPPLKKIKNGEEVNTEHSQDDQCPSGHSIPVDQCLKKQDKKIKYAEFVSMTNNEYSLLVTKLGDEEKVKKCIEILDNYKGVNGKRYKSDYRAILNWVINRLHDEERLKPKPRQDTPENQKRKEMIKSLYLS